MSPIQAAADWVVFFWIVFSVMLFLGYIGEGSILSAMWLGVGLFTAAEYLLSPTRSDQ